MLADLPAATLKFPLAGTAFQEHLTALQAAFRHHAGSEEHSMFKEAGRLSMARLTELGAELDHMLDKERTSRARQAFRSLKIRLLERS